MSDYASLVFLSYQRPQFIFESIHDAVAKAGYPCELIVHDDGSTEPNVQMGLLDMLAGGVISRLILNPPGHNEGVGAAINRGFSVATGHTILKLDQDLLYTDDWLARVVGILKHDAAVGMLGLFKYHCEPVPWDRMKIHVPTLGGYHYTRQFCGSGFAIPRRVWEHLGRFEEHSDAFAEDMDYMQRVRTAETPWGEPWELALPDIDLVHNRGFGIGPSTVVEEGMKVHEIHHESLVFGSREGEVGVRHPEQGTSAAPVADSHLTGARKFEPGVVLTTCAGREENLRRVIEHLMAVRQYRYPAVPMGPIVVVYDGCPALGFDVDVPIHGVEIPKHEPGMEQPRNVGFRRVREIAPECNYVWFLDSDMIFQPDILGHYYEGLKDAPEDRILIGPYDWLHQGVVEIVERRDDPRIGIPDYRWVSFDEHPPADVLRYDLGAALACFGGNLVWPVDEFERVGGFHPDLHHGRCEDGELGLRAASAGVPMSFVPNARAWHVWHPVDNVRAIRANERDVPLLNSWHPWVQQQGLIVAQKDGARFDFHCPQCGDVVNSLEYWPHTQQHER